MIERLSENTVFVHGEIHHIDDHPDYWSPEDEEEHDEAVLDGVISGIHPHEHPHQLLAHTEAALIARSVMNHPSSIKVDAIELGHLAIDIIRGYYDEVQHMTGRRRLSSKARRAAVIAVMRNQEMLSDEELRFLAHELDFPPDHFVAPPQATPAPTEAPSDQRLLDWRERQHKD